MLALILCMGVYTQYRIELLCDDLHMLLAAETDESFWRAKHLWDRNVTVLSVFIRHDRIDNITESFARAGAFLSVGTTDEHQAEVAQLITELTWLQEYDRPNLRSIF